MPDPSQTPLSTKRAADRRRMKALIQAQVAKFPGCTCNERLTYADERRILLEVTAPGDLSVNINLDGNAPHPDPNTFVLSWVLRSTGPHRLSAAVFSSVNPYHGCKATDAPVGLDALLDTLSARLGAAVDGSAYVTPAREAA